MGVFERGLRPPVHQELAKPVSTTTSLKPGEVVEAVAEACGRADGYDVRVRETDILITHQRSVDDVLAAIAKGRKPRFSEGYWLANLRMVSADSGQTRISIRLTNWVADKDGRVADEEAYLKLTEIVCDAALALRVPETPAWNDRSWSPAATAVARVREAQAQRTGTRERIPRRVRRVQ